MDIEDIIEQVERYNARCDRCRAAGGISFEEVLDNVATIPLGYIRDDWSGYYIPPHFDPDKPEVKN